MVRVAIPNVGFPAQKHRLSELGVPQLLAAPVGCSQCSRHSVRAVPPPVCTCPPSFQLSTQADFFQLKFQALPSFLFPS